MADAGAKDATAMDAEDEEDALHLQKGYLTDQLEMARDRGNAEAAELFTK